MKIETKLSYNDNAYTIYQNKVINTTVLSVLVLQSKENLNPKIIYTCRAHDGKNFDILEGFIFNTKEELLKSL